MGIEETYTKLVYNGLWYSPLKTALDAFIQQTQERVSGSVRVKLFKGNATIVGRHSENTLYTPDLATYGAEDQFDHKAAEGFIYVWGLPTRIWAERGKIKGKGGIRKGEGGRERGKGERFIVIGDLGGTPTVKVGNPVDW